jgi:rubrerythrin
LDIAYEEKVHIGEFEAMLLEADLEHQKAVEEGKTEVSKLLKTVIK